MAITEQLQVNSEVVVDFEANPDNPGLSVKSNVINGTRIRKIVLVDEPYRRKPGDNAGPRPGQKWRCRLSRIVNPGAVARGAYLVQPLMQHLPTEFENVWLNPDDAYVMGVTLQNPNLNLYQEGPTGCGKTTAADAIAKQLRRKLRVVQGGMIKKYTFLSGRTFAGTNADGEMRLRFVEPQLATFLKEAQEHPNQEFQIMFDEFSRIATDAQDILLSVIYGQLRELLLANGDHIYVPDNVHFNAAGNIGDGYVLQARDKANKDRWVIVKQDYMPFDVEVAHCMRLHPTCPKNLLEVAVEIVNIIRDRRFAESHKDKLAGGCSTRAAETIACFLASGVPLLKALQVAIVNPFDGEIREKRSDAARANAIIVSALEDKQLLQGAKI